MWFLLKGRGRVGSADSPLLPPVQATTVGRHRVKRPKSSNPRCGLMVGATKALLKGELSPKVTEGFARFHVIL